MDFINILIGGWGNQFALASVQPLHSGEVVSYDSIIQLVNLNNTRYILKKRPRAGLQRSEFFHELKAQVLTHCVNTGVRVSEIIPTLAGEASAVYGDFCYELQVFIAGEPYTGNREQEKLIYSAAVKLRHSLDHLPDNIVEAIRQHPIPSLVEEENPILALEQARELLLAATKCNNLWKKTLLDALIPIVKMVENRHYLMLDAAPKKAIVHGDIHAGHWIFPKDEIGNVVVLDFDNLRYDTAGLDYAWAADTVSVNLGSKNKRFCPQKGADFLWRLVNDRKLTMDEAITAMQTLINYSLLITIDICKDVIFRGDTRIIWKKYLEILCLKRKSEILDCFREYPPGLYEGSPLNT